LLLCVRYLLAYLCLFFFSSRRRHTRSTRDWSSDVCSSDLVGAIDTLTLRLNPELALTYASLGDRIMISTDPAGVRQVATAQHKQIGRASWREREEHVEVPEAEKMKKVKE